MDAAFDALREAGSRRCRSTSRARYPKAPGDSEDVHRAAIRAKALDTLRGMLPAATQSNVGIYGTGQAFEALLLRMRAHPLAEVRACADADARRAAQGDPRVPDARRRRRNAAAAGANISPRPATAPPRSRPTCSRTSHRTPRDEVTLTDFDPDGEIKIVAAALYAALGAPRRAAARARAADVAGRARAGAARLRRRRGPTAATSPGRAFERTTLPLRRPDRLRRLPRPAAPPAADPRMAAADDAATASREPDAIARGGCRRRLGPRHGRQRRPARGARVRRAPAPPRSTPSSWPTGSGSTWR